MIYHRGFTLFPKEEIFRNHDNDALRGERRGSNTIRSCTTSPSPPENDTVYPVVPLDGIRGLCDGRSLSRANGNKRRKHERHNFIA
jgi:hypothetical protein